VFSNSKEKEKFMNQEKEIVKNFLNRKDVNFYQVVNSLVSYINIYDVKVEILNSIVLKARNHKNFTGIDLFKYFYEALKPLVENTIFCPTAYNAQMLLKNVWETLRFQNLVITQIKNNYKIIEVQKQNLNEEELKEQRLKKQAEVMRAAKAKKAAEKKAIEDAKKQIKIYKVEQKEKANESKKLSPEQEEQIRLLRNLKI
jgi:hypothetical protein